MPKIILHQLETHTPWQIGELVVVKVSAVDGQDYTCETVDTFPPDLKDQHAQVIAQHEEQHRLYEQQLNHAHAQIETMSGQLKSKQAIIDAMDSTPAFQAAIDAANAGQSAAHQETLTKLAREGKLP